MIRDNRWTVLTVYLCELANMAQGLRESSYERSVAAILEESGQILCCDRVRSI